MLQHSYTTGLGENLYELQNTPARTAPGVRGGWHSALQAWYDSEAPQYNWGAASYGESTGHFTQARPDRDAEPLQLAESPFWLGLHPRLILAVILFASLGPPVSKTDFRRPLLRAKG